ncbi:MAG: hypothetical protein IJZ68_10500 [Bacteroidaceae bacterium]|nr:hypothetical protein [Bacteroidaceae bacterium]
MRIPHNTLGSITRDKRKHILFLNDLFVGSQNVLLTPIVETLKDEYHCMNLSMPKGPHDGVRRIRHLCMSESLKPDLIVAHGTAATIAAQIIGIEKVLIKPYFCTSNMISNMLPEKQSKARIELPNLDYPEYLTISRQMATEYHQQEERVYQRGIHNAHALFFASDTESPIYKNYVEHFGNAVILPAENDFSPKAVNCIVTFIKEILSVEQKEQIFSEEDFIKESLREKISEDDLERINKIFTIVKQYHTDREEKQNTKIRKFVITKSVTPRRELDNKENIHYNTEDMNAFNIIEYLKKEPFDIDEYLQIFDRAWLLSREKEQALVEKAQQGDEEAMNLLLWSKAPVVTNLANQYTNKGKGASLQQLLNVAMSVLQKAVLEYDVHNEDPLIKFAVPLMREALEKL